MSKAVYIFRHAETYFSKHKIPYGTQMETAEIIPEGIPPIEKLSQKLNVVKTDANFTSPYKRCLQTVKIVNNFTGKKFVIDKRLHDFHNESINAMLKRLQDFINDKSVKNCGSISICTHGYPAAIIRSLLVKGEFQLNDLNTYPKPGTLITIINRKAKITDFN